MTGVIYVLRDPRTKVIRYVGFTTKSAWRRLRGHLAEASCHRNGTLKYGCGNKVRNAWLLELRDAGLEPECEELLRGVPWLGHDKWEYKVMDILERYGAELTNRHRGLMEKRYAANREARLAA